MLVWFCPSRFLDSLSQVLDSYLPKIPGFKLLKSVFYLCLLGHFPSAPLEQLLQSSTIEQFNNTRKTPHCFFYVFISSPLSFLHLTQLGLFCSSSAPKFLQQQQRMFQTLDLCLRLDRPPLPRPLTVPASVLGDDTACAYAPPANQWLLESLQGLVQEQADTALQEMAMVENFYLIGRE